MFLSHITCHASLTFFTCTLYIIVGKNTYFSFQENRLLA
jgi:DNA repair protein RadC